VRAYLTQNMPLNFGLEESSLALVGEHGVHQDKEELRGYGFFPKTKMAGIYRLDCNNQNDSSLEPVEMVQIFPEMNDDLSKKVREYFLWVKQYPEILNLWISKSNLLGLPKNYDHWLVLVNLPGDKGTPSWWKFVEFRSEKGSSSLEEWAGAFAHPIIPGPPQPF
ncbi:MAG: hypothetical protein ACHQYQ_05560, partial [Bacteriovoracales bacterium]